MSRRIQIVHRVALVGSGDTAFESRRQELRIYSPQGRAVLEHDPEMLLTVIACIVTKGSNPMHWRLGWNINGTEVDTANVGDVISGREQSKARDIDRGLTFIREEVLFDAGEIVYAGDVSWRLAAGSAFNAGRANDILTPPEMLLSAAKVLIAK